LKCNLVIGEFLLEYSLLHDFFLELKIIVILNPGTLIFFQHRVAQENILYKDEQLREAHAWVAQVRDMDVLQSQSLQVELRERMEQFNQYWISSQQQVSFLAHKHHSSIHICFGFRYYTCFCHSPLFD
jgi:hypothetical protein